jgi:hypothetical protein
MRYATPLVVTALLLIASNAATGAEKPADKPPVLDLSLQSPPAPPVPKVAGTLTLSGTNVDGLKYSLELRPADKHAFAFGEPIQMVLKVRNPAKFAVNQMYSTRNFYAAAFIVTDAAGKAVDVTPPNELFGAWAILKKTLEPEQEVGLSPLQLLFRPAATGPRGQSHTMPTVYAPPGKYKVSYPGTESVEVEIK